MTTRVVGITTQVGRSLREQVVAMTFGAQRENLSPANFKTNLSPSDSDRLRFPLKIGSGHLLDHFVSKSWL